MNENVMKFRVGVTIVATLLIAGILFLTIRESPLLEGTYRVYIRFSEAPGVSTGTPVRKDGIRIGRVANVQFAENDSGVIVTADIDKNRSLYNDEQCQATTTLLMGDASLDFKRNPQFQGNREKITAGQTMQGQLTTADMSGSIAGMQRQVEKTLGVLNQAGQDMHTVLTHVDGLVAKIDGLVDTNRERITDIVRETGVTMQLLQTALRSSNDILGDPELRAQIKQTIATMPEVLRQTRTTVERVGSTFTALEENMRNMEGITKPLGERGGKLVDEFDDSMRKLNLLGDNLLRFSNELNDPQGSLGAVLHDKELYQHVNHIAKNLDELIRDLKPIVNNVSIFTDKIARHPATLGVRGALEKDSGLKDDPTKNCPPSDAPEKRRWPIGGGGEWSVGQ